MSHQDTHTNHKIDLADIGPLSLFIKTKLKKTARLFLTHTHVCMHAHIQTHAQWKWPDTAGTNLSTADEADRTEASPMAVIRRPSSCNNIWVTLERRMWENALI